MSAGADLVRRYYAACSAGDVAGILETLAGDVAHFFLEPNPASAPVHGAQELARHCAALHERLGARWTVDHLVEAGDEVVIEWTMAWTPPGGERVLTRGTEWLVLRDGRIAEVRAYHALGRGGDAQLAGFPYDERGYSARG